MNPFREITLGEEIFRELDNNSYLHELYENILFNYSCRLFKLPNFIDREINIDDALRFADLLSKSTGTQQSDNHKLWGQEIVALLNYIYPQDEKIKFFMGSVLSSAGNYRGLSLMLPTYKEVSLFDRIYSEYHMKYLSIPAEPEERFFPAQKMVYDKLTEKCFSYSAPTSMGKSFMMRMFIKKQVMEGVNQNFALVVPTKALINEVSSKLIDDLKDLLKERNYRVLTAANGNELDAHRNFIFVVTPERLLYMMISNPEFKLDYLFIDEAHKISAKDKRSAFYYKIVDMLTMQHPQPHFIFASPNIPNPEVFLDLVQYGECHEYAEKNKLASSYAPVSQLKYMIDFVDLEVHSYNSRKRTFDYLTKLNENMKLQDVVSYIGKDSQNIVYCSSKNNAIQFAREYGRKFDNKIDNKELNSLAKDIRNEVHGDYYLAELVEQGIAYHIGYLPTDIRMRLEELYREGLIKTIFCTSTLIEGVNLPADNLFITSYKSGLSKFSEVDFKNLIGRVGRIKYNLYGNVFITRLEDNMKKEDFIELVKTEVPRQELSVVSSLSGPQKERIVQALLNGSLEFDRHPKDQSADDYDLMRKFALILIKDIVNDRNSRVKMEFSDYLSKDNIEQIQSVFANKPIQPDNDINVSIDQTENLVSAIASGMCYPAFSEETGANYADAVSFMERLCGIFKWDLYEKATLGKRNKDGNHAQLRWYIVIMLQWMKGYGLSNIISESIKDKKENNRSVEIRYREWEPYNGTRIHKNIVIADTLEAIEEIVLFRISNYFLKFSEEYKRQHGITGHMENDWYEYVEYGTTNKLRILLQSSGFSREASTYIRKNAVEYIVQTNQGPKLKRTILECGSKLVKKEASEILYNIPELFIN